MLLDFIAFMIQEAGITLDINLSAAKGQSKVNPLAITKSMTTFYNPKMASNRNISIAVLNSQFKLDKKSRTIALPLSGSGIRALRFLKELPKSSIKNLHLNDHKINFKKQIQKSLNLNNLNSKANSKKVHISSQDANLFLLNHIGFDYIDIDPFGSPNPFLAAAISKINRGGILAITATDTAALAGTYPKACKRKYWASPLKCYMMHEIGIRILIRKIQLIGVQFSKALTPIISYHKDHYYRIFFKSQSAKSKCDRILKQHLYFQYDPKSLNFQTSNNSGWARNLASKYQVAGPIYIGPLHDQKIIKVMLEQNLFDSEKKLLQLINTEAVNLNIVGFIDSHLLSKKYKIKVPTNGQLLNFKKTWRTQFSKTGIKTSLKIDQILKKLKTD
jgi:tRNA (guanine26-N2/guanine27-N2)-dimethyltransferase